MSQNEEVKSYCPHCKMFEHRDGDYCSQCGGELTLAPTLGECPKCHLDAVRPSDRYCKNCGARLVD